MGMTRGERNRQWTWDSHPLNHLMTKLQHLKSVLERDYNSLGYHSAGFKKAIAADSTPLKDQSSCVDFYNRVNTMIDLIRSGHDNARMKILENIPLEERIQTIKKKIREAKKQGNGLTIIELREQLEILKKEQSVVEEGSKSGKKETPC